MEVARCRGEDAKKLSGIRNLRRKAMDKDVSKGQSEAGKSLTSGHSAIGRRSNANSN